MRTDTHRPKEMDPGAYKFCAVYYQGPDQTIGDHTRDAQADAYQLGDQIYATAKADGHLLDGNHAHKGTCDHCGAAFHWGAIYQHNPTDKYLIIGNVCANEWFDLPSNAVKVQKIAAKSKAIRRKRAKHRATLNRYYQENPGVFASVWAEEDGQIDSRGIIADILGKCAQYFSTPSDGQGGLILKLYVQGLIHNERKAQWAKDREDEPHIDCPEGKVTVSGVIVKTDTQENDFGTRYVMTVKDDRGFLVWGTQPESIGMTAKGDRVQFTATVTRSDKDPQFGFFSRPRAAVALAEA